MSDLPEGWATARVEEIAEVRVGRQRSPDKASGPNMRPYLRAANVTWEGLDFRDVKEMNFEPHELASYVLQKGDILLAEASGSAAEVGKPAVFRGEIPDCCFQNTLIRVRPAEGLSPFLYQRFLYDALSGAFARASHGFGLRHLGAATIASLRVNLPPLAEQGRIVEKVEDLMSRRLRAKKSLEEISELLEHYRRSVLAAAFRGDLTKEWRKDNPNGESGADLLAKIRLERRRQWEETELAKALARGEEPTDRKWKRKYAEPEPAHEESLPALPEAWCWARVGELASRVVDGVHKKPDYQESGVPFLTVRNLTAGPGISFDDVSFISAEDHAELIKRAHPEKGDILISKDGTLGVTRLVHTEQAFSIFVSLALVKPIVRSMGEYLELAFSSPEFQDHFKRSGTGLQHIHLVDLRSTVLPVAPVPEQHEIVRRCRRLLDGHDVLARLRSAALDELAQIDRTILAGALRGDLVTQDPTEEPASVLLGRIRDARAKTPAKPPPRRRKASVERPSMSHNDMKDKIKTAIRNQASDRFSFDDLRAKIPGSYDVLKESLFDLLAKEPDVVRQVFDRDAKAMRLERRRL